MKIKISDSPFHMDISAVTKYSIGGLLLFFTSLYHINLCYAEEGCFCQLQGEIDDCSCRIETIDSFNNYKIFPRLKRLLETDYFKYYLVNIFRKCPFESDAIGKCGSKSCAVDECKPENLPPGLKKNSSNKSKYSKEANVESKNCVEETNKLGDIDTHISDESKAAFQDWKNYDDAQDYFCEPEDEESPDAAYYDLVRNPERFTGYTGPSAVNVWKLIYDQNCFKPDQFEMKYYLTNKGLCLEKRVFFRMISGFHTSINVDVTANWLMPGNLCLEMRTFFRIISGMHTSINTHLCAIYPFCAVTAWGEPSWGPNVEEFKKRFDPEMTDGEGTKRLKNLYFTYLVELRALAKAAPFLAMEEFYTGNEKIDSEVKENVKEILHIVKEFPEHFEEDKLFKGDALQLKEDFKLHFRNISRIMDCVGCDKCRLWGKLQIQGMGTALKILFSGDSMGPESTVTPEHKWGEVPFQLTRGEIVSLFNAFGRLSQSIHELETFRKLMP